MTDPIADFLTRIRNAVKANHKVVEAPGSKIKQVIKRTDRNICFLYPVWDLSCIYACRYSESAM